MSHKTRSQGLGQSQVQYAVSPKGVIRSGQLLDAHIQGPLQGVDAVPLLSDGCLHLTRGTWRDTS